VPQLNPVSPRIHHSNISNSQAASVPELFFACSASRTRRLCPLYVKLGEHAARMHKTPTVIRNPPPLRDVTADERALAAVLAQGDCSAQFCSTCCKLLTTSVSCFHSSHDVVDISNVFTPSRSLPNLGIDEASAQYVPPMPY
jgi:hypothetical protein